MHYLRTLSSIKSVLLKAQHDNLKVNLLMGAGCSKTAGIPLASGMISEIKNKYAYESELLNSTEYGHCMSLLTPNERRTLIYGLVENAKINWAHIGIAQLMKNGYINRIFTTNFDNLVTRACSLVGEYPGVYDLVFANADKFRTDLLYDKSILHLHGQHTGFILCNTDEEVQKQANSIRPIFQELNRNSVWIVVGYSGSNDAIFELLSECDTFENRLFWIGYNDNDPAPHIQDKILKKGKYGFYVKGYDADSFFVELSKELNVFPPIFIDKPFTYLEERLDELIEYKMPRQFGSLKRGDVKESTKSILHQAIESIENNDETMLEHYIRVGKYDKFSDTLSKLLNDDVDDNITKLYIKMDDALNESVEDLKNDYNELKRIIENGSSSIQSYFSIEEVISYLALTRTHYDVTDTSSDGCDAKYLYIEAFDWLLKAYDIYPENIDLIRRLYGTAMRVVQSTDESHDLELYLGYCIEFLKEHYTKSSCSKNFVSSVQSNLSLLKHIDDVLKDNKELICEWISFSEGTIRSCKAFKDDLRYVHTWLRLIIESKTYKVELNNFQEIYDILEKIEENASETPFSIENTKKTVPLFKSLLKVYEELGKNTDIIIKKTIRLFTEAYSLDEEKEEVCFNWLVFLGKNFDKLQDNKAEVCERIHKLNMELIIEHNKVIEDAIGIWYDKLIASDYLKYEVKNTYMCELIEAMKTLFEDNILSEPKKIISKLNQFTYSCINRGNYLFVDKLLDLMITYSKDEYPIATLGYWYLNNKEIDSAEAEIQGKSLYETAVKLATFSNKELGLAFNQKYFFELSKFYNRMGAEKDTRKFINDAYQIGEVSNFEELFSDVSKFQNSLPCLNPN